MSLTNLELTLRADCPIGEIEATTKYTVEVTVMTDEEKRLAAKRFAYRFLQMLEDMTELSGAGGK